MKLSALFHNKLKSRLTLEKEIHSMIHPFNDDVMNDVDELSIELRKGDFSNNEASAQSKKIKKGKINPLNAFKSIRLEISNKNYPSISHRSYIKKTGTLRGKYRIYTDELKEEALRLFERSKDARFVSQTLHVPLKNIDRWVKFGIERKKGGNLKSWEKINERRSRKEIC